MRVVRVARRKGSPDEELMLHAQLTVVRGLEGPARAWFVDTIGHLDAARVSSATGEVEVSGIVLPLDSHTLDLLGIDEAGEAVVDPRRLVPEVAELGTEDLDGGGAGVGRGAVALRGATGRTPAEEFDPVDSWFSAEPDHADLDDMFVLEPGEVAPGDQPGSDPAETAPPASPLQRRIVALRDRRHELERLADEIASVELDDVSAALSALDDAPKGVPLAEAAALADEWKDLQQDVEGLELGTTAEERAAMEAVVRARDAVEAAEVALSKPVLNEEQIARIEAAHVAYIEASDKVERRFGGGRARKQLAEAEAEESRLLGRFGFGSWVDYMLSSAKHTEDPDRTNEEADLEAAQAELAVCVGELDAIPGAVGRRHRRARLRERQEDLSNRIARVLGHQPVGDDVEADLRSVTSPYDPSSEMAALAAALDGVGVDVSNLSRDPVRLADKARQVVASQAQADKRRSELTIAVDALDEALEVLRVAIDDGATEVPSMPALPDMAEPPVSYVDMFDDEGDDVGRLFSPGDLMAEAPPLGTDEAAMLAAGPDATDAGAEDGSSADSQPQLDLGLRDEPEQTTDADAAVEPGDAPWSAAVDSSSPEERAALVDDVHWEAMMAIAGVRTDGPAGQLPVVFDDPFTMLDADECLQVLSRLVRLTDHVQLIVVTDRPEVADWAGAIGPEHAAVLELSP